MIKDDLMDLAKKMNNLMPQEKDYWIFQLAVYRDAQSCYSKNLSYHQILQQQKRKERIIVSSLSQILFSQKENAQVKRGVKAFSLASKDDCKTFCGIILDGSPFTTKTSFKTDLMRLAKEMQFLSNIDKEFSSDKEFFLHQLIHCRNLNDVSMDDGGSVYLKFKKTLTLALTKKLSKKAEPKTNYEAKKKLVEKGIQAYMEASEEECTQFHKIVHQEPTIVKKSSSRTSHSGKRKTRVRE